MTAAFQKISLIDPSFIHDQFCHPHVLFPETDILAVLYGSIMNFRPSEPGWPDRPPDRQ